jgi:hypothetical protein
LASVRGMQLTWVSFVPLTLGDFLKSPVSRCAGVRCSVGCLRGEGQFHRQVQHRLAALVEEK